MENIPSIGEPRLPEEVKWVRIVNPGPAQTSGIRTQVPLIDNAEKYTFDMPKVPTTILGIYIENAKATAKLLASALSVIGEKVIKQGNLGGLIVGIVGAGSLIAAAAIKAAIWTPFIILTVITASTTGLAFGVLGGILGGDLAAAKTWGGIAWKASEYLVAGPALLIAGLSILVRWVPIAITLIAEKLLEVGNGPKNPDHAGIIKGAAFQIYQDSYELWRGGKNTIIPVEKEEIYSSLDGHPGYRLNNEPIYRTGVKKVGSSKVVENLIRAGANPYSSNFWGDFNLSSHLAFRGGKKEGREVSEEGTIKLYPKGVAELLVKRGVLQSLESAASQAPAQDPVKKLPSAPPYSPPPYSEPSSNSEPLT